MKNLREKIGQRLVVGIKGKTIDKDLISLIKEYKIGNFIVFKENVESGEQITKLCYDLQELVKRYTGHGAFISIDQEGGMVTRLQNDCVNIPGAMAIAATKNPENALKAGRITGQQLRSLGINFNLAPVADINSNRNNPVIGVRSYGDDPTSVALYTTAMAKGLLESGVMASAKHFPGHGDTYVDSHIGLPQIDKTLEELNACELIPFKKLIEEGIPAIMTAHILFPKIEANHLPATMSRKIVTDILKNEMGFKGLVVSDCMEMDAIQKYYGSVEGVVKAIQAGVDMVFISHTHSLAREASDLLFDLASRGEIDMDEMDKSVEKIVALKSKYIGQEDQSIDFDINTAKALSYQLLKTSITAVALPTPSIPELGEKPFFVACKPFRATNVSNLNESSFSFPEHMKAKFGGEAFVCDYNPTSEEIEDIVNRANGKTSIIIGTYNGHIYQGQLACIERLAQVNDKIIVFALRNPYDLADLPKHVYGIAVYEYTLKSLDVIEEWLEERYELAGVLPVSM
jgi:beta-N-acetylhexosaminidase